MQRTHLPTLHAWFFLLRVLTNFNWQPSQPTYRKGRKLKLPKPQTTVFYYMRMQNGNDMLCLLQMAIDGLQHSESGFEMRKQRGAKTN